MDAKLPSRGSAVALKEDLMGYESLRVGRLRVIYHPDTDGVEIVTIGPRRTIYENTARQILRHRRRF
jgi:hypothetical protein